ncbi:TPA: phage portal protein [Pseudomonas aeruginosa]|uniref:Phage portal protein, HK97 family n=1 Tax=Pseudomonas paraeruginosa (strain DSM 24068 / PA7) TaxID=381754 RepID=A6VBQ3_PSEP7|nr:phage portal protein [Pseudomonas aeruginosa]NQB01228.1 phage portal protein [Pseudomonas paraeruginosa]ABR85708.1 phage portal protein, HK97 family [Pseudomonas aeruginosa PA7]EIU1654153.1 phage portal protein [Pseudomonas aeruginosa]EKE4041853.1 phage portal protein [Pseudomonas aeruginosa]EKU7384717.1 phage portal protein [Pseudomonas aeruginosa]
MKFLDRLLKRNTTPTYDTYWNQFTGADVAGVTVNVNSTESISAVYACVAAISESVGSLPLNLYRKTDSGREKATTHPLYRLLHDQPNEWQTALEFREQMQRQILLRGNAFAEIKWSPSGRVESLVPLHPLNVTVSVSDTNRLLYDVTDRKGHVRRLLADEVLHLRYHSDDGVLGRSPIAVARDTIGLALAERTHGERMFAQGTKLSGVIETQPGTTKDQAKQIRESWAEGYGSVSNHGKTGVLPQGATFKTVSMTLEDAEWIEARRLSVEEVARLFRVPPVLIGDLREANYSNAVELGRYFVTHTLRRHLVLWEQAINRSLITDTAHFFAEFNVEGLLRGDSLNRAQFYDYALKDGWMLKSEVRQLENLPAIQGINDAQQEAAPPADTSPQAEGARPNQKAQESGRPQGGAA